jgi:hypothetical protein
LTTLSPPSNHSPLRLLAARAARWLGLAAVIAAGLASLVGSGGGGGGDGPAALTVISTSPTNGATGVAVSATVSATFSENLSNTPTLTVTPSGGAAVAGAVGRSGSTATFTPAAPLAFATTYTASVSGGTGASGGTQSGATTWTFTTAVDPNSPPSIVLGATALAFTAAPGGANPAAQTVAISNGGGLPLTGLAVGAISYGAGASGWLQAPTLSGTTAPATLTVQPLTGALAAGTYTATIQVTSGVAGNSPRTLTVTFTVAAGTAATISGTADFESVGIDTAGNGQLVYGSITHKPIRAATVEVVSTTAVNGVPAGTVLASGTTSSTGAYSLTIPAPRPVIVRVRAEMKKPEGAGSAWDFSVRDNTAQDEPIYALDSAPFTPTAGANTRNVRALSGSVGGSSTYTGTRAAGPFAILDTVYDAVQKVLSASASQVFPPLKLMWSVNNRPESGDRTTGAIGTSFYTFSALTGHRIYILGQANVDTDEYDRPVVAHEFGHYMQSAFSRDDSLGGAHAAGERLDMRVAFSEGWGNAWSGMALASQYYTDSFGNGQQLGVLVDLAALPDAGDRGWYSERSVQYLMYQWHQNASIGFAPIFNVLAALPATLLADGAVSSIHHFAYRLKQAVPGQAGAIDTLLGQVSINAASPLGVGETNSGNIADALPVYRTHTAAAGVAQNYCLNDSAGIGASSEANKLAAHLFIRVTLLASGNRVINVAATTGGVSSNPDFLLIRGDGAHFFFDTAGAGSESSGSVAMAAGTHIVVLTDAALTSSAFNNGQRCFNVTIQ